MVSQISCVVISCLKQFVVRVSQDDLLFRIRCELSTAYAPVDRFKFPLISSSAIRSRDAVVVEHHHHLSQTLTGCTAAACNLLSVFYLVSRGLRGIYHLLRLGLQRALLDSPH